MIDNFFQQPYHSYDKVYTHPIYQHNIYIGDIQSAMDHHFHQTHQIKLIVTAARDMDQLVVSPDITHIRYNLLDGKKQNISTLFDQFYQLVQRHIIQANILVHCAAGISRSATLVISYLIKKQKISFKDAIGLVRKSRANVLPNLGFQRQLKRYEQLLMSQKGSRQTKRSVKRNQVKTSQSGKYQHANHGILEYQPQISLAGFKYQPKSLKKPFNRLSEKQLQIFKIYGRANSTNQNKALQSLKQPKKDQQLQQFSIGIPKTVVKQTPFIHRTLKYTRKYPKRMKTSIQQINQLGLQNKRKGMMMVVGEKRQKSSDMTYLL